MDHELFAELEKKVEDLVRRHRAMKAENERLAAANRTLVEERDLVRTRIDDILCRLQGLDQT